MLSFTCRAGAGAGAGAAKTVAAGITNIGELVERGQVSESLLIAERVVLLFMVAMSNGHNNLQVRSLDGREDKWQLKSNQIKY